MPQTPERKRLARIASSKCSNAHPHDVAAATMRPFGKQRIPLCGTCDEVLSAVVEAERAEEATKESRLLERRATLKERLEQEVPRQGNSWPWWALVTSSQILDYAGTRDLGPWAEANGRCDVGGEEQHDAEAPFVFHCREHAQERQGRTTSAKPEGRRDKGICITCGAPAELNPAVRGTHRELCVRAELAQITVARLCTQRLCYDCKPQSSSRAGVGTAPRRG